MGNHANKSKDNNVNRVIIIEYETLKHGVASVTEAETLKIFQHAQTLIPIRHILQDMGRLQPLAPIKTDNTTSCVYVHNNIQLQKYKYWDMWHHWLYVREALKHF